MTIDSLIERVSKATGADRQIDHMVGETLKTWIDFYTSDLSAAVALVERVLPGKAWFITSGVPDNAAAQVDGMCVETHVTPALALILALLMAVKETRDGR